MSENGYFLSAGGSKDIYDPHQDEESRSLPGTNIESDGSDAETNNGIILQGQDDHLPEIIFNGPTEIVTRSLFVRLTDTVTEKLTKSTETNRSIVKSEAGTRAVHTQQYLYRKKAKDMLNLFKKYAEENNIRAIIGHVYDINNQIWFKARDVASILGYNNTTYPINKFVKDENKIEWNLLVRENHHVTNPACYQASTIFIDIEGAYDIMFNSPKEGSKKFYKWLTMKSLEQQKTNSTRTLQLGQSNDVNNYDAVEVHEDTTTNGENTLAMLTQMQTNMTKMVSAVSQMQNNMSVLVETNRKLSEFALATLAKQSNQPVVNANEGIVNNQIETPTTQVNNSQEKVFYILHKRGTYEYQISDRLSRNVNVRSIKNNENFELIFIQRYKFDGTRNMKGLFEEMLIRYNIQYQMTNKKLWVYNNLKEFLLHNQIEL